MCYLAEIVNIMVMQYEDSVMFSQVQGLHLGIIFPLGYRLVLSRQRTGADKGIINTAICSTNFN